MKIFNRRDQKDLRGKLRSDRSKAEQILWIYLKGSGLGSKFRRQHGIGRYVVDFYCPASKLIIEIDGDSHFENGAQKYDDTRSVFFQEQGLRVFRFTNNEVYHDLEGVLGKIKSKLV